MIKGCNVDNSNKIIELKSVRDEYGFTDAIEFIIPDNNTYNVIVNYYELRRIAKAMRSTDLIFTVDDHSSFNRHVTIQANNTDSTKLAQCIEIKIDDLSLIFTQKDFECAVRVIC